MALLTVACSAPVSDATSSSNAAVTSSVPLEKSRIDVAARVKTHDDNELCAIDSATFRVSYYQNPDLPPGTQLTLHVGHAAYDQSFTGDGFGWTEGREVFWQDVQDLAMSSANGSFSADLDVNGFVKMSNGSDGSFNSQPFPPEIEFAFKLDLPDGTTLWDNRLNQNYDATAVCNAAGNNFAPLTSWGPF